MHYLSCCRYSLNIFWAFQTACSGLKFSIQSYCLLFFLSSFPQNQYVDSLNSLQQATYHIYVTSSHCLSNPISVSLVIEQKSQLQLCYTKWLLQWDTSCTHLPAHRVSRGGNLEQTHVFEWTYVLYVLPVCRGSDRICVCVIFIRKQSISNSPRPWEWWMAQSSSLGMALRSGGEAHTLWCHHPAI